MLITPSPMESNLGSEGEVHIQLARVGHRAPNSEGKEMGTWRRNRGAEGQHSPFDPLHRSVDISGLFPNIYSQVLIFLIK